MAVNPDPKVGEARRIAQQYSKTRVIVLMIDDRRGTLEYASYGADGRLCNEAKKLADVAYDAVFQHLAGAR